MTRHRIIETCNAAFSAIFSHASATVTGKSLSLLYPSTEEYRRIGERGLETMRATGRYQDERIMRRRDGTLFWCRVEGSSATPENPFARAVWCLADISDLRPVADLTRRERQVAMLITEGRTSKEIAGALGLSPRTVEAHRARLIGTAALELSRNGGRRALCTLCVGVGQGVSVALGAAGPL